MKNRMAFAAALLILFLMSTIPAKAQATQSRAPFNFALSGCPTLPAGLTVYGSGEDFLVIKTRAMACDNRAIYAVAFYGFVLHFAKNAGVRIPASQLEIGAC